MPTDIKLFDVFHQEIAIIVQVNGHINIIIILIILILKLTIILESSKYGNRRYSSFKCFTN